MSMEYSGFVVGGTSHGDLVTSFGLDYIDRDGTIYKWHPGHSWAFWVEEERMDDPLYIAEVRRMESIFESPFYTNVEERYTADMQGMTIGEFDVWLDSIIKKNK